MTDFHLPELGENIKAGDVLRILVKPGDTLAKDQPVLELETDKATIEVPSSVAGQVKEIKVKPGEKVKVGQAILSVDDGALDTPKPAAAKIQRAEAEPPPAPPKAAAPPPRAPAPEPVARQDNVVDISRGTRSAAEPVANAVSSEFPPAPAAPSVRRMARELGVDVNQVPGTEAGGRISVEDVKAHAKRLLAGASRGGGGAAPAPGVQLPGFSRWGGIERQPMRAGRRKTAEPLSA